ncbi:MAG TPA: hypothetical protein VIP11_11290 [Gemmatimonadaceae bacterium]
MTINRRDLLAGIGGLAAGAAFGKLGAQMPAITGSSFGESPITSLPIEPDFPRKADFNITPGYTYISGAYTHPMPIAAAEAYRRVVDRRGTIAPPVPTTANRVDPKAEFAKLINAKPEEISFIPNTSTGENLVVECLGIARNEGMSSPTRCISRVRSFI